jgi:hypothetical protein
LLHNFLLDALCIGAHFYINLQSIMKLRFQKFFLAFITATLLLPLLASSQEEEKTIFKKQNLEGNGGWGGYRWMIGEVAGQTVNISSFHMLGEYERKYHIGYNFNWVSDKMYHLVNGENRRMRFRWHSLQCHYIFAPQRAIHPIIGTDLGIGRIILNDFGKDRIYVAAPSTGLELNLYRWFHLAVEGGYRAVFNTDLADLKNQNFSGFFGLVTLKFGWSDVPK